MMIKKLFVKCDGKLVGTLALTNDKKVAFQYYDEWIENGFSISPFSLPLDDKVRIPSKNHFNGLFGVFADSLPDSWGNLLLDRMMSRYNLNREEFSILDRLAVIGNNGMGLLTYEPVKDIGQNEIEDFTLDELNIECEKILKSIETDNVEQIYKLAGSSGGARPKVLLTKEGKNWIVKFSNTIDSKDSGLIEYEYFKCAKECGINVPETRLYNSTSTSGYFGIERFDIINDKRIHMITVAGLLEVDFRSPCLDYKELIKLTKILSNEDDTYEMFRRMCFNVFSHNMDDHAKNFTFLYDEKSDKYRLSPAYDLTYSRTYYNEHTTSVNGKGKDITDEDLLKVGTLNYLNNDKCKKIITEVKNCVDFLPFYFSKYSIISSTK